MSGDQAIGLVSLLGFLTLVGMGLVRRRLPARTWITMMGLWLAIIVLGWATATLGLRLLHADFT